VGMPMSADQLENFRDGLQCTVCLDCRVVTFTEMYTVLLSRYVRNPIVLFAEPSSQFRNRLHQGSEKGG
jgi:hypothetical protein